MTDAPETKTVHLTDDRRMGGVTRFLEHLCALRTDDEVVFVKRNSLRARKYDATTIVSHLAISWRSLPMLIALRACNPSARLIHVEHSYCAGFEQHRVRKTARFHTLLRAVYALFDRVVAVSEGQAAWLQSIGVGPEKKLTAAPALIDLQPFLDVSDPEPSPKSRYGYVGRLDDQKGLDIALEAWTLIAPKNATLDIFGDGPKREALEASVKDFPNIRFHGKIDDPARAYESFDVALMPSRWEPYGLSCVEARAAGRSVVVADVDGLPEQMRSGGGMVVGTELASWLQVFSNAEGVLSLAKTAQRSRQSAINDQQAAQAAWTNLLGGSSDKDVRSADEPKSVLDAARALHFDHSH